MVNAQLGQDSTCAAILHRRLLIQIIQAFEYQGFPLGSTPDFLFPGGVHNKYGSWISYPN